MSAETSSSERVQFSVENAYTASDATPRSIAVSTTGRSAREPARCPSATETPCSEAQRPLPSMMIATAWAASGRCSSGLTSVPVPGTEAIGLDLHHIGLFVLQKLVDL